jgi:hypothetical protein
MRKEMKEVLRWAWIPPLVFALLPWFPLTWTGRIKEVAFAAVLFALLSWARRDA